MNRRHLPNNKGFTLVELMVTLFLTAIAVVAIYRGYTSFSQSADVQQQNLEMQQNLRIGMNWLARDLRRAGMNEEDEDIAGFTEGFTNTLEFTMDLTGAEADGEDDDSDGVIDEPGERDGEDNDNDGAIDEEDEVRIGDGDVEDAGEQVAYYLVEDTSVFAVCPTAFDPDKYPCMLLREESDGAGGATPQKLIANVDALNFVYLDEDGAPLVPGGGGLTAAQLAAIRSVQACLVVRTTNEDFRYTNTETYSNIDPTGADVIFTGPGDNFRRRVFCQEIRVRNLNL